MYRTRRPFIVVLTILTIVSIVGLIVTPAGAVVGPNPPGSSAPGIEPDLGYEIPPKPSFAFAEGASVIEGGLGDVSILTFELVSPHPTTYPMTFHVSTYYSAVGTNAATPGVDYLPASSAITVPAGGTSATFDVEVLGDHLHEGDEFVRVLAYEQGRNIVGAEAYGWIIDDDPDVAYSLADAEVYEGGPRGLTNLTFDLTASEPLDHDVHFLAFTQPGTATAGDDYVSLSYTPVVLKAGETSAEVKVRVKGDTVVEDDETLTLQLYRLDEANIWHLIQAIGTILDDDVQRASNIRG